MPLDCRREGDPGLSCELRGAASADIKDAEYALAVALGAITVEQRTGQDSA